MGKKRHRKGEDRAGTANKLLDDLMTKGGGIIDFTEKLDFTAISHTIKMEIENGATVEEIASYRSESLKAALSYYNVEGRSKLTYKKDMAEALIKVLSSKKATAIQGTKQSSDLKKALARIKELEEKLYIAEDNARTYKDKYKALKKKLKKRSK